MITRLRNLPGFVYPIISIGVVIAAWFVAVRVFAIPAFVLPDPTEVGRAIGGGFASGMLWPHLWATLSIILGGYAIGACLAVLLGALLAESLLFERFVYPLLTALQALPKVALGPIILVWLGFGATSKLVLVVLVCFFPLFVNTVTGIRRADPDLLDACRAFSASRAYLFFHVKLPSAASDIFAGLQIGVSLALIGAVVAEFLSSQEGLGYLIASSATSMNVPTMFSALILLALIGVIGTEIVRWIEGWVVFWEPNARWRKRTRAT